MQAMYSFNTYYLVRHGEAENNVLGILNATSKGEYALTLRGKAQAQATAEFLVAKPIDFIVTSPLLRARETADIIQMATDKPLLVDMRLCEPQFGTFEGQPIKTFLEFMKTHGGRTVGSPELGIEGFMDIRERVRSFLLALNETFQGKHVVIVSHMDTLQEIYGELCREPVGAEQGEKLERWYPKNGSCRVVITDQEPQDFLPAEEQ